MYELVRHMRLRGWSHYVFSYADPASWTFNLDGHVDRLDPQQAVLWVQWLAWPGPMCSHGRASHFPVADAFGYVLDGKLVSVAQLQAHPGQYAWEYGVDTLPACRRRGYATATASAATVHILRQGRVPYHYADAYNRPSLRLPEKLGYVRYGEGLFSHVET